VIGKAHSEDLSPISAGPNGTIPNDFAGEILADYKANRDRLLCNR